MAQERANRAQESRAWAHRVRSLTDRFYALLTLPDRALEQGLSRIIQTEHELAAPARYEAALSRLRAWLELDPEDQLVVASAYDRATAGFPADYADSREEAERAVILNACTFAEFRRLAELLSWLRQPQYVAPHDDSRPPLAVAVA
jgi:hypothetical protein